MGLVVVGKTSDDKLVVQGMFDLMSSVLGLPLEYMLDILNKNNMVVDWVDFYKCSVKHCWSYKTLRNKIDVALFEIYGKEYRDSVLMRLDFIVDTDL